MPKYSFSLAGGVPGEDWERSEFANDDAARKEAELIARDLARNITAVSGQRVVVRNEQGDVVCEVRLRDPTEP
jgi:hypothetical protein